MSCFMLSSTHIATVANGLAFLLNREEMSSLATAPELFEVFTDYDEHEIFRALYRLNEAAYNSRYHENETSLPVMPDNAPRLLHRLAYHGHYILDNDFFQYLKLLDAFIYQCDEQATANTNLQKALTETASSLYAFAVQQSTKYNAAPWII